MSCGQKVSRSTVVLGAIAMSVLTGASPVEAGGWTGCYLGAHVGYAHGDASVTDLPFTQGAFGGSGFSWNDPPFNTIGAGDSGVAGGGEAGCDYQFSSPGAALVVGIVADIGGLDLADTATSADFPDTNASFDIGYLGSLRGRLGFGTDKWLAYVTGGYAFADIDVRAFDQDVDVPPGSIGLMDVSGGGTESGWVLGGGLEYALGGSWSLGLEYLHYEFDGIIATGEAVAPAGAFPRFESDIEIDVVRVGAKWRPW